MMGQFLSAALARWRAIPAIVHVALIALLASISTSPDRARGDNGVRTVALTGQHAAGLAQDVNFSTFATTSIGGLPALNDRGRVAWPALISGPGISSVNGGGSWAESAEGVKLVAQYDDNAPGDPTGIKFFTGHTTYLNNADQVGLLSLTKGPTIVSENRHALFLTEPGGGNLAAVARGSDPAPGAGPDATFGRPDDLSFNDAGDVVFASPYLSPTGGGTGLWRFTLAGGLTPLAISGAEAAGVPGATYAFVQGSKRINAAGQLAFNGSIQGDGVSDQNDGAVWVTNAGGPSLFLREGDQAPGAAPGVQFMLFGAPVLNDSGHVAIDAYLRGAGVNNNNIHGFWKDSAGGNLALVARDGQQAPGTPAGVAFSINPGVFGGLAFNNAGHVAFYGGLTGSGVNSTNEVGIWSEGGGQGLQLVMREGDLAPGAGAGVRFSITDNGGLFGLPLNDAGHVAFGARLVGTGVTSANNQGIWAQDQDGAVQLIVRTGQTIDIDDGPGLDMRTISAISNATSTPSLVHPFILGFNNRGQLLFQAKFTDGSEGLFVSNLVANVSADFDADNDVDGADFLAWQRGHGIDTGLATSEQGDADLNGRVAPADLAVWNAQFGSPVTPASAVPEPTAYIIMLVVILPWYVTREKLTKASWSAQS